MAETRPRRWRLPGPVVWALNTIVLVAVIAFAIASDRSLPAVETTVVVPEGATARDVGVLLQAQHVVRSSLAFDILARLRASETVKAGEFVFPAHVSLRDVFREVTGTGRQLAVWVTIPEGFTAKQIARTLADRGIGPDASFSDAFLSTSLEIDGVRTRNLEGYLFPDTYLVPQHATPAEVATIMTDRFRTELPADAGALAKAHGLTVPQVVTLASLVEREGKSDAERPLIAGVFYNRLARGMPLQADATLEYAFAHHKDVITYADLALDTPYNSYKYAGLPPTPIANPGRPSLMAAFHPRKSDFLYYVYMGNGRHAFARTLAEHNANVARYLH